MDNTSPTNPPPFPPPPLPGSVAQEQGDSTGGIIPYKNPHALASYYLGLFSIIPLLGLILGCIAVPLGISGLKKRKRNPLIRRAAHAWVGIICGGLSVAIHLLIIVLVVVGNSSKH